MANHQTFPSSAFSVPGTLNFTRSPDVGIFGISTTEIVISADLVTVASNDGPMGQYKLSAISPDPAGRTATPNPANNDTNMTIGGLDPGTSHNLSFVNVLTLCGSSSEGPATEITDVCTSELLL